MGKTGSALRQILEQEHADRQRILSARDDAAKLIEAAQRKSAQLITQANEEARQLIAVAENQSLHECESIRREYISRQDRILLGLANRLAEIETTLGQDIALKLVGYEH